MPAAVIPERAVAEIWRQHLIGRNDLETEDGQCISVVYPGMVSADRGADFVDAVIDAGQNRLRGNIEIHVNSSGWWGHGHHEDPFYNDIILHVVYHRDRKKPVRLQNGGVIPTLVLDRFFTGYPEPGSYHYTRGAYPALPCSDIVHSNRGTYLEEILSISGAERFRDKVAGFKEEISRTGSGQTLYSAIMESLGYAKNKNQMKKLAGLLPFTKVEKLMTGYSSGEEARKYIQAVLLGAAGLLPSRITAVLYNENPVNNRDSNLEKLWESSGEKHRMVRTEWEFFKVRPGNYPGRRLTAMSCLLSRYRKTGILKGLMSVFHHEICPDSHILQDALLVPSGENGEMGPALLGKGRASDIVVNALLPFVAAFGEINSQPALVGRALEIYCRYPRLSPNNLERHMSRQLGIDRGRVTNACQQQGLIYLYRTFCKMGKCPDCPLVQ